MQRHSVQVLSGVVLGRVEAGVRTDTGIKVEEVMRFDPDPGAAVDEGEEPEHTTGAGSEAVAGQVAGAADAAFHAHSTTQNSMAEQHLAVKAGTATDYSTLQVLDTSAVAVSQIGRAHV